MFGWFRKKKKPQPVKQARASSYQHNYVSESSVDDEEDEESIIEVLDTFSEIYSDNTRETVKTPEPETNSCRVSDSYKYERPEPVYDNSRDSSYDNYHSSSSSSYDSSSSSDSSSSYDSGSSDSGGGGCD